MSFLAHVPSLLAISSLLFVLAWSASRLLGGRMPHLRLALWVIVLARLVVPPTLVTAWSVESPWLTALPLHDAIASPIGSDPAGLVTKTSLDSREIDRFASIALALWIAGAVCSLGRWLFVRRRQLRRVQRSAVPSGPEIVEIVHGWSACLKVRRRVGVFVSPETAVAFTVGTVHPAIYLPAGLEQRLSREALDTVVAHELAHVKRLDELWLMLETVMKSIYFFHPVVWIATARLRDLREQLTDELVIDSGRIDGRGYANVLLDAISVQAGTARMPALVESSKRALERRLTRLRNHRPRRRALALIIALTAGGLLLPAGLGASPKTAAREPIALQHPLPGARVTSPFGRRNDPFSNAQSSHRGVDLAAAPDSLVLAAAGGTVITATTHHAAAPDQGTVVLIRHSENLSSFSSHLGALLVEPGQTVSAGQPIARVGASGRVTGPHLHFEVIRGTNPVDPLPLIAGGGDE